MRINKTNLYKKASDLYLSKMVLHELGIISFSFPTIADYHTGPANMTRAKCKAEYVVGVADCVDVTEEMKTTDEIRVTKYEEQVDVQEGLDVQGLPGGLDAIVDGACADGVEAEGGAHHRQGVCQTHADAGVVCEAPSAGPGRQV